MYSIPNFRSLLSVGLIITLKYEHKIQNDHLPANTLYSLHYNFSMESFYKLTMALLQHSFLPKAFLIKLTELISLQL